MTIADMIDEAIAAYPEQVEQYRNGKTPVAAFFVGKVMRQLPVTDPIDFASLPDLVRFKLSMFLYPPILISSRELPGGCDDGFLPVTSEQHSYACL